MICSWKIAGTRPLREWRIRGNRKDMEGAGTDGGAGKRKAVEGAETREGVFHIMAAVRRPGGGGRRRGQ
jgi:hypothetical protein